MSEARPRKARDFEVSGGLQLDKMHEEVFREHGFARPSKSDLAEFVLEWPAFSVWSFNQLPPREQEI
eukprot:13806055-Alexandrium_andersonii.AAC.1